uniref:hypothetical protein n=1 Tax=Thermogutta sp. TaxID=1962930 RepID=UPI0032208F52
EHLAIIHAAWGGHPAHALRAEQSCVLRQVIWAGGEYHFLASGSEIRACLVGYVGGSLGLWAPVEINGLIMLEPTHGFEVQGEGESTIENALTRGCVAFNSPTRVKNCAFLNLIRVKKGAVIFNSCVLQEVIGDTPDITIQSCGLIRGVAEKATIGAGSFLFKPQFINPDVLDYRLGPQTVFSPGVTLKQAIGVRYTPEMLEVIQVALELRRAGIIKF